MRDDEVIRLQIPGAREYIGIARYAVDAVSEQLRLPDDVRMAVRLAVGEACNNAVQHARRPGGCVCISCRIQTATLEIDVTNLGNGFHPEALPEMPSPEDLSENGRGIALMGLLMDHVEFLSEDGNTTVRMRKKLPV